MDEGLYFISLCLAELAAYFMATVLLSGEQPWVVIVVASLRTQLNVSSDEFTPLLSVALPDGSTNVLRGWLTD